MKNVSAGFRTMLRTSTSLLRCDLAALTLKSGTVLRYTNAPLDITVGANTFLHDSEFNTIPGLRRGPIKLAIGLAVDSIDVELLYDDTTRIGSITPGAFAAGRGFDGARLVLDALLTPDFADTSRGTSNLFTGVVSEVEVDSSRVRLRCASDLVYLNAAFPPRLFQPCCNNALFDYRCGLDKTLFAVASTATTGGTQTKIATATAGVTGKTTDYFALGYVVIGSGANAGLIRSVKSSTGGNLTLLYPLPAPLASGDTFTAYPGCAKTEAACDAFGNRARFGGMPFQPSVETTQMGGSGATDNTGPGAGPGPGGIAGGGGGVNSNYKLQ